LALKEVLTNFYPEHASLEQNIARMLQDYYDMKQRGNLMDFDDLLVHFLRLLRTDIVKEKIFNQVRHLLVDEYQDVNQLQADIVIELGRRADSVMVVGDDAQAIYSFRGASIQHMLEFPDTFEHKTKKYFLTTNYRSYPPILTLANASIKHNKVQFKKELKPTRQGGQLPEVVPCTDNSEEANFICQAILHWRGQDTPIHEQAVLFRAAHLSLVLEKALLSYKIPYVKRAGLRFYETAHIKDFLSFCFIVVNPKNEIPWSRVLGLLPGMGSKSVESAIDTIQKSSHPLESFIKENLKVKLKGKRIQTTAFDEMERIQNLYKEIATDPATGGMLPEEKLGKPDIFLAKVMKVYEPLLKAKYDKDADERLLDLKEFLYIASSYPSIRAMVDEIAISETFAGERVKDPDKQERPLVISTVHQAKGLEWDVVYVIGVTDNTFPSPHSATNPVEREEERRVFYVAATRARKHLCFSYPISQWSFTDRRIAPRSSFLDEIEDNKVFKVTRIGYQATSFDDLMSGKQGW
nr:ATP-dependent helicase [Candidatus Sigynarchaeota archaeon]